MGVKNTFIDCFADDEEDQEPPMVASKTCPPLGGCRGLDELELLLPEQEACGAPPSPPKGRCPQRATSAPAAVAGFDDQTPTSCAGSAASFSSAQSAPEVVIAPLPDRRSVAQRSSAAAPQRP